MPRNPYGCVALYGVDLVVAQPTDQFKAANLALEQIPFPDSFFDSVSAYDFFEHVPRVLPTPDGRGTRAPFIELMDEIWRVLRSSGRLYAQTPAYPHAAAFQDPTHVNIITRETHKYFVRPELWARPYGYRGTFNLVRVKPVKVQGAAYEPVTTGFVDRIRQLRRERRGALSHLIWEFEAVK